MAETLTIRTASSTEVVKIAVPGPQGATGQGVPVGGSTGQVLRKKTGTDYDTEWAAAGSGSGSVTSVALASTDLTITGSPITTSGTITANIAANAVTLEKLQTISSEHLLGRHGNGNGGVQQVGLGTGLAMSGSNIQCTVIAPTASSATPSALGTASSGSSSDYARADHAHSAEVSDSAFRVLGSTDATKKVAIEVDTNVPSGQTVTLTAPSSGGTIARTSDIPSTFAASAITSGVFDNDRVNFAAPAAIGSTTPAAGTFTDLVATTRLKLPLNAPASPTAGDLYRTASHIRFRNESNVEQYLLVNSNNLSELTSAGTARDNLGLGSSSTVTFGGLMNTPVGVNVQNSGSFTTLSASGTVSGTGFSNYLASPPAIGGTSAAAGSFTTLSASTSLTLGTSGILSGGTNIIEQRNTTSAQTFRIYNTVSGAADANFERGFIGWSSNTLRIGTEKAGTGSARALALQTDGITRVTVDTTGQIGIGVAPERPFHIQGSAAFARIDRQGNFGPAILLTRMATGTTVTSSWLFGPTDQVAGVANDDFAIIDFGAAVSGTTGTQRLTISKSTGQLTVNGNLNLSTKDLVTDTTTGTKIGTGTTQKLGFWNAAPSAQPAAVADATDAASTQARLNDLLARLRTIGIIAT